MPLTPKTITIDARLDFSGVAASLEALGRELHANGLALIETAERLRTSTAADDEAATMTACDDGENPGHEASR